VKNENQIAKYFYTVPFYIDSKRINL